jgi:Ca2+-binding RTX toxin-like protein
VTPVNDAPTAVVLNDPVTSTAENGAAVKVADIAITDDEQGTNVLSLSGDDASSFHLVGNELWFNGGANFEVKNSYDVTVDVDDNSVAGSPDASQSFTLNITNLDEVAPSFDSLTTAAVNENIGAGQVVYTAAATDPTLDTGPSNPVTYSFGGGADDGDFTIDGVTGAVTLTADPDAETKSSYSFAVTATDAAGNATTQTVTLAINDVDEFNPAFTASDYSATVAENISDAAVIATVAATDQDATANITYSITGGAPLGLFEVGADGKVSLAAGQHLDFETTPSYILTVEASDGSGTVDTATVTITVTDADEIAPGAPSIDHIEDDEGLVTGNVTPGGKTDDAQPTVRITLPGDALENDRVQLYNSAATLGAAVILSSNDILNGFVDVPVATLNDGLYDLSATVIDQADNESVHSAHFAFTVDTDAGAAPTAIQLVGSAVPENSINGTVVGTVEVTDPDVGDTFTFSLLDDGDGHFAIDANTGVVTVVGPIDFETDPTLVIKVQVTDSDANTFNDTLVIQITDVNGVTIKGSTKNDKIDATHHVKGQTLLPTGEEDTISGGLGNDKISSLGGNDFVKGGAGNDKINGGDGDDKLKGGAGNDKLTDGLGNDVLTGGAGADTFSFSQFVGGPSLATLGIITDFKHSQLDKIDLHLIDAIDDGTPVNEAFHFITGAAFTQAGQVRYDAASHQLLGNTDGDTDAEFAINLTHVNHLLNGDFIL